MGILVGLVSVQFFSVAVAAPTTNQGVQLIAIRNAISNAVGITSVYSGTFAGGSEYSAVEGCLGGINVPYSAFNLSSTAGSVAIATVPDNWSPRAIQVQVVDPFTSGSPRTTAVSAWIGACAGCEWFYLPPFPVLPATPPGWSGGNPGQPVQLTSHTLYLTLGITNVNPGTLQDLTGGSVAVKVCGVVMLE